MQDRKEYDREYYKRNREKILKRCRESYQKNKERKRELARKYYQKRKNNPEFIEKQRIRAKKEYQKRKREGKVDEYLRENWNRIYRRIKERRKEIRLEAYKLLGGARCVYCGCDYFPFLEVNHKFGGGNKEAREKYNSKLGLGFRICSDIVHKKIKDLSNYEVVCRVCNAHHFLKLKEPTMAKRFDIKWK